MCVHVRAYIFKYTGGKIPKTLTYWSKEGTGLGIDMIFLQTYLI